MVVLFFVTSLGCYVYQVDDIDNLEGMTHQLIAQEKGWAL